MTMQLVQSFRERGLSILLDSAAIQGMQEIPVWNNSDDP